MRSEVRGKVGESGGVAAASPFVSLPFPAPLLHHPTHIDKYG